MALNTSILFNSVVYERAVAALIIGLIIVTSKISIAQSAVANIDAFQWQHRVILVQSEPDCVAATEDLTSQQDEVIERDILWFVICNDGVISNYKGALADQFIDNLKTDFFDRANVSVILVGKDGGVKLRANALELAGVFDLIDSMPMRRSEIND